MAKNLVNNLAIRDAIERWLRVCAFLGPSNEALTTPCTAADLADDTTKIDALAIELEQRWLA